MIRSRRIPPLRPAGWLGLLLLIGTVSAAPAAPKVGYHLGDQAPNLTLLDQNDNPVSLSTYQGKSILLTFAAAWCGPCMVAAPSAETVVKTLNQKKEPTQFVEVLVQDPFGEASIDTDAQDWADQFGLTGPVLQMDGDPNSPGVRQFFNYSQLYGGPAFPTVVLLSPHRRIINVYLGFSPRQITSIFLYHTAFEPRVMVDWLMTSVERLSLQDDLAASLGKQLGWAMQDLDDTDKSGALMRLDAFIQAVHAAVDQGLTADQAAALTKAAQKIETTIGPPP
jgi:thiol-disulfide isomerase/thioredoxin